VALLRSKLDQAGDHIAIDGKTSRRSGDRAGGKLAIHTVSAWLSGAGLVLGQVKTDDKSNEITAIPELLRTLDLKGTTVTIDAMGCQRKIASCIKDGGGDSSIEVDLYGGYKGEVKDAFAYDLGVLTYVYPSNALPTSANTTELYGALSVGPITLKYSHSLTNLFGTANSKNSGYLDLSATFDVAGISVTPHVGRQIVNNSSAASYTDYSLLASKAFGAVTLSAGVVGMNGSKTLYVTPAGKFTGKNMVVAGVKYSF
jgi:hypothetical protein